MQAIKIMRDALEKIAARYPAPGTDESADEARAAIAEAAASLKVASNEQKAAATELYAARSDDNIEIDDTAYVSETDDGYWVSAWLWLANETKDEFDEDEES